MWTLDVVAPAVLIVGFLTAAAAAIHRQTLVRTLQSLMTAPPPEPEAANRLARLRQRRSQMSVSVALAIALTLAIESLLPSLLAL